MRDSTKSLSEICTLALNKNVNRVQIVDLLGKIQATLGGDYATTKAGVGGGIYELVRAIKIVDRGHQIHDPKDIGDNYYNKGGINRVRQQKWATGTSRATLKNNLSSAICQLAGVVDNNPEVAPAGSVAIMDIVLADGMHTNTQTTLQNNLQTYMTDVMQSHLANYGDSALRHARSVSLRVTVVNGGNSTKYCADYVAGTVTVRTPQTKQRDEVIVTAGLIELLAADVRDYGRAVIKNEINQIASQI
ncbi:hypothetical protein HNQ59_000001 [Chitinivorax tropicus]|uniref:Uncharacterized protein n=1 Tax=Chitinivorax tropicus TaxID=714531 RepID=A0A840MHR9_9PROT|nr:hypothetical protein [Chitinivorax tropicus]MBB5016739.1 hypothetical protein [Chitinivorax tropicus]